MKKTNENNGLTLKHKIGYAAGDCGGIISNALLGGYMTRYITNILGLDFTLLAGILLIWNIWDAVNDPLMGTIMDKSFAKAKNKKNKFRPWVLRSIPLLIFGMVAFFCIPARFENPMVTVAAVFCLKIIYEFGYTMLNIAMGSMLAVMAKDGSERATLTSARGYGSTIGNLVAAAIAPQILARVGETADGYAITAVIVAILATIIILTHYGWTEERNTEAQMEAKEEESIKITDILEVFKKNRPFLALCIHSVFICCTTGVYNQASAYMYADVIGDISYASYTTMISMGLTMVALAIVPKFAKKYNLVNIIRSCQMTGIVLMAALFLAMITFNVPAVIYLIWSGLAFALINLSVQMQWGLVAEAIDYNEYVTGKRTEGSIYGTFSLSRRVGQTIANSLAVLIIGWIGYDKTLAGEGLAQAASTITGLKFMGMLIPAIFAIGSWLSFTFIWNINSETSAKVATWRESKKTQQ